MHPFPSRSGYPIVEFTIGRKNRNVYYVHELVLTAFVGPRPVGMETCHNDGNPLNNHLTNLRWDTHQANQLDRNRHGTSNAGERHGMHKLTEEDVRNIRKMALSGRYKHEEIANKFGIHKKYVGTIKNRKIWKHVRN
jgi:hypothetical protein